MKISHYFILVLIFGLAISECAPGQLLKDSRQQKSAIFHPGLIILEGETETKARLGLVLAVDDNPNPHGWYFLAPGFEDRTVTGRWTDGGLSLQGDRHDHIELTYQRSGSSAKQSEPLSLQNITTLAGSFTQGEPGVTGSIRLTISWTRGPLENGRWYDFGTSDAQIEQTARKFLRAIEQDDAAEAARHVDYPISAYISGKLVKVRDRDEFVRLYSKIFPKGDTARLSEAIPHDMFHRDGMAAVLNGTVWFSETGAKSIAFATNKEPEQGKLFH